MSTTLVTVEPDATVAEAAQLMSIHHVGAALVLAGGTLHGIFTERDIVRALAAEHDAAGHTVTGWMSHDPVTLPPEATIAEAHDRMLAGGVPPHPDPGRRAAGRHRVAARPLAAAPLEPRR